MSKTKRKGDNQRSSERTDTYRYILAVIIMGIFTFLFLYTEYLYVDRIALNVSEDKAVLAQNYALGVSALGFVLYPIFRRYCNKMYRWIGNLVIAILTIGCILMLLQHISYEKLILIGFGLFLLLGMYGSAVFYKAMQMIPDKRYLARVAGTSYMLGIVLQFINNNLVSTEKIETVMLAIFMLILVGLLLRLDKTDEKQSVKSIQVRSEKEEKAKYVKARYTGICLIILMVLMSCIFSTLDNAVTLVHATGAFDIGQLPRILLAVSGLLAGVLFDIRERKFMSLLMYCMMLVSTICIAVFKFSGPFLAGLIVFYMTAGFFVVFFTTSFMEISEYMKLPDLWAGLGRAVNNITAAFITNASLKLLSSGGNMTTFVFLIVMFIAVSVVSVAYTFQRHQLMRKDAEQRQAELSEEEKVQRMVVRYSLTPREMEVLYQLVSTEDSIQEVAEKLYISKRTLERHISAIYEKTGVKSRVGLMNIYNEK